MCALPLRRPTPDEPADPPAARTLRARATFLELLFDEAARARAGTGRLVLLGSATGMGRTALLEAAAELGAGQGMRALKARCSTGDSGAAFTSVRRLLEPCSGFGLPGDPPDAPDAPNTSAAPNTPDAPDVASRLWRLLHFHAAQSPLLLAVDDVHLADPSSRRWFTETARRLDQMPVLLVATERNQYDIDPPSPGLAHTLSPSLYRTFALAPLSGAAAEEMVRTHLGAGAAEEVVKSCVRAGAGNPLLLRALLDDMQALAPEDAASAAVPHSCAELYPGAFTAAVAWWLENAGPSTTAVARALAELEEGHHVDNLLPDLLPAVTGADPARVSGWVTAMVRLGLLRRDPVRGQPRFVHGLLRDAMLNGWSRKARQTLHRAAAEIGHGCGDRAEAVAAHLLQVPPVGAAWAVDVLLDAAPDAVGAGRTGDAAQYLRRALEEPMPRERRATVLTDLGSLEFAALRSAGISRLAEALRLHDRPRGRVKAAVALSSALAHQGEAHAAFAVLKGLNGSLPDEPTLNRTVQAASALLSDHDTELRRRVYAALGNAVERSPTSVGPAEHALTIRYEATAGLVSAERAMERIHALLAAPEDPLMEPFLLGTAAAVAQWADELDEADRLVQRGLAEPGLSRLHPMYRAMFNTRTDTALARARYAEVLADDGAWDLPADRAARPGPTNLQAGTVLALVESDRLAEAHALITGINVLKAHDSWELNRFLYARGLLRAVSDDLEGALDDFLECGRRQSARDVVAPVVTPWRSAAAECVLALGRPQEAIRLAEQEYRFATVWNTPRVVGRALRALGAATGGRRGLELTGQAVKTLRDSPAGTELIRALISQGRQLTAAGQQGRARPLLREAASLAEQLGTVRLRAAAVRALSQGGARRTGLEHTGVVALTSSERRVAALAADGRTNAEIAELLHLARRTVETHLTHAYRKLGIRRRTDLPAALERWTDC
ncbi:MAG: AAA family ATPase [Streptomycetaceae bacterium]|nr:AAA family ATPase [Streptomycetaceae bacterium]